MKFSIKASIFSWLVLYGSLVSAQHFSSPDEYLNFIGKQHKEIAENITDYTGEVVKGKAKKLESKRKEIIQQIKTAGLRINSMHPYKVDKSFQDSAMLYLSVSSKILTNDVPKILTWEDSLGKSYNSTKKYLDAKENIVRKLAKAEERLNKYGKVFVTKYKIKEEYNDDDVFERLQKIENVNSYQRSIYLTYLKNSQLESELVSSINKKDTAGMKLHNQRLTSSIKQGNNILDSVGNYNKDNNLMLAAKQVLQFYQVETEFKVPMLILILNREDSYNKLKKAVDAKPLEERTQEEKDQLARESSEYNDHISTYANTTSDLNIERAKVVENWNKVSQAFLSKNIQ